MFFYHRHKEPQDTAIVSPRRHVAEQDRCKISLFQKREPNDQQKESLNTKNVYMHTIRGLY